MKIRNQKSETGITLVALIITIIILIILAGVALNITIGENGIFQKSKEAVDLYKDSAQREESELDKLLGDMESVNSGIYIPEGFEHTEGSIDTGYVIKNTDTGDEFVWIPVETPVLDLSNDPNDPVLSSDFSIKNAVQAEIDAGRYPMAIKTNTQDKYGIANYIGVLYSFYINEAGDAVEIAPLNYWTPLGTSSREPANLDTSYDNISKISEWTETLYQEEYNKLVESVIVNKGFYVGRYESGNLGGSTAVSQKGATGINSQNWYQMYKAQKNIYGDAAEAKTHMIWGSQWDQVMIWMKDVPNTSENVTNGRPFYILNSIDMGVYSNNRAEYWDNETEKTTGKFEVKNVYDLGGNVYDWTMEADGINSRTLRGSGFFDSVNFAVPEYRNNTNTFLVSGADSYGSRLTLYK